MKQLIVHVGPHKTGTTSIQQALQESRARLSAAGIEYRLTDPHIVAHHRLGEWLLRLDYAGATEDSWYATDGVIPGPDALPDRADSRQLISAEGLVDLGPKGHQALTEWAAAESTLVIATLRHPYSWLWSMWQQNCKMPGWSEWEAFVEKSLIAKNFFPSRFLSQWLPHSGKHEIRLIAFPAPGSGDLVAEFEKAADIPTGTLGIGSGGGAMHNQSLGREETLLTAAFVQEVGHSLEVQLWARFGEVPRGFVARACLDVVDHARPMFERAQRRRSAAGPTTFFTRTSPAYEGYIEAWTEDCRSVANGDNALTDTSRDILLATVDNLGDAPVAFPVDGFVNQMPVDSELLASARATAAAIGSHWRSARHVGASR